MKAVLAIGAAALALALPGCGGGADNAVATANTAAPIPQIAASANSPEATWWLQEARNKKPPGVTRVAASRASLP